MARLNLNENNFDDLGNNLAKEIMMFREQHGKINDWNELLEIPGFTPMLIDDLKNHQASL